MVTFESLLKEMADLESVARLPRPSYRLRQQSSYDRASRTPDEPEGWFANRDFGQFIRIEENGGRREWVILEHEGPGALVRYWMTDKRAIDKQARVNGTVRIYFDGARTPAVQGHMIDLFNGSGAVPPPFAHRSLASAVSYLPLPFAHGCKVTLDEPPLYYILTYRAYAAGTKVKTFSMQDLAAARAALNETGRALLGTPEAADGKRASLEREVPPGGEVALDLPPGPAAVRELSLWLASYQEPQVTRSMVVTMEFDGGQTVWCPAGDFFGTGIGLNPFEDRYRTVTADGRMTARWPMPYRKSARLRLVNCGAQPVTIKLAVAADPWRWDDRSMYFHANWRRQYPLKTRPFSDWNLVEVQGRGVYAGDTLTVWNPGSGWWGEGDDKTWVDGDAFPSLFGTGTEDYYGYAWGGRNRAFYEHPFHAQVRVQHYNKTWPERAPFAPDTSGYSTETRSRSLDRIPFESSLRQDLEVWNGVDCAMEYNVATYWYGRPGARSNRVPQPGQAAEAVH